MPGKCYQETTYSGMIKRAKERYERRLSGPNETRRKSWDLSLEAKQRLTPSKTSPYNRDVCFFCIGEGEYHQPLDTVRTLSAGRVRLDNSSDVSSSIKELLKSRTELLECLKSSKKPTSRFNAHLVSAKHEVPITVSKDDFAWLLVHTLIREESSCDEYNCIVVMMRVKVWSTRKKANVPVWLLIII